MHIVTEEYVSTRSQIIDGIIYGPNEVVPRAAALQVLPALIRTQRLRPSPVVRVMDEPATDLGTAQAAPKPKTRTRTKGKK